MANGYPGERIAKLEERMERAEEFMGNSLAHQRKVEDFISRSDERAIHRAKMEQEDKEEKAVVDKRRARIHFWWLGLLSGAILLLLGEFLSWTKDFESRHHVSTTPQTYESR